MTVGAHFQINQASNSIPTGTSDVARTDLRQAVMHFVGDSSSGQISPSWTILAWPGGSSRVQPTNRTTFDATYTPDVPGSYLGQFIVNDGLGTNVKTFVFAVIKDANGLIFDDGIREPAYGEVTGQDNSASNDRGWALAVEGGIAARLPVVDDVATLLTRRPYRHKQIRLLGTQRGDFYWDSTATDAHNFGTCFQPGYGTGAAMTTGRWRRDADGHIKEARWFGAKGDGRKLINGVVTVGTNTYGSVSGFTIADEGKRIVVRTPSLPTAGTVSCALGDYSLSGTNFFAEFHWNGGDGPLTGGLCIYLDGNYYSINNFNDTTLFLHGLTVAAVTNKVIYKEQQKEAFVKYVNPTTISLWTDLTFTTPVNATISQTNVQAFIATDDSTAIDRGIAACLNGGKLRFEAGLFGITRNHGITNGRNMDVEGAGPTSTIWTELRKASTDDLPGTWTYQGAYSIVDSFNCYARKIGYDASVPVLGMQHSTGGFSNGTGARVGFIVSNSPYSGLDECGWGGYGARDEHSLLTGIMALSTPSFSARNCIFGSMTNPVNGPGLNISSGNAIGNDVIIDGCTVYSAFAALELSVNSALVTNCHFGGYQGYKSGSSIAIVAATGRLTFGHCQFRNHDSSASGVGAIEVNDFGIWNDSDLVMILSDCLFTNLKGLYGDGGKGVINLQNFRGTAYITDNTSRNVICDTVGGFQPGRMIEIDGANTGNIYIGGNIMPCNFAGGSNMQVGLYVNPNVPAGRVHILPGNDFGDAPTPYVLGAVVAAQEHMVETVAPATPAEGGTRWVDANGDLYYDGKDGSRTLIASG